MKLRLILMRHAKSDWGSPELSDHDRPLNERGERDAPRIAAKLVELEWIPDYVVSSDALRTRQTWELMAPRFAAAEPAARVVEFRHGMYLAGRGELSKALSGLDDHFQCVLALGHNPGWEEAASWLTGQPVHLTTANAVLMSLKSRSWQEAIESQGAWKLEELLRPKELDEPR